MAQGAAMQQQINFTRANENEADRVGIGFLAGGGFRSLRHARLLRDHGPAQPSARHEPQCVPEILQSHPVSTNRIAESRARAAQFKDLKQTAETVSYALTRERLRVLATPAGRQRAPLLHRAARTAGTDCR